MDSQSDTERLTSSTPGKGQWHSATSSIGSVFPLLAVIGSDATPTENGPPFESVRPLVLAGSEIWTSALLLDPTVMTSPSERATGPLRFRTPVADVPTGMRFRKVPLRLPSSTRCHRPDWEVKKPMAQFFEFCTR
jgi:hypothetical protein